MPHSCPRARPTSSAASPATWLPSPAPWPLLASGLFAEADIKSRAIRLEQFAVGVVPAPRAFVHLTLSVLSGRSADERAALARQALAVLEAGSIAPAGTELQLSVDVAEMERATYAKAVRHA